MKIMGNTWKILLGLWTFCMFVPLSYANSFVTIGTGGVSGVYYPTGAALCRIVSQDDNIDCAVESTGGSVHNINLLKSKEIQFGISQSDWQHHAYRGTSEKFKDAGQFSNLRAIFALHGEVFTVVARSDGKIKDFKDLKNKRVNVSNPGSGARPTMDMAMGYFNLNKKDFKAVSELAAAEQARALCDNKVDAIVFVVGHPSGTIKEATTSCDSRIVKVVGNPVDKIIKEHPYYSKVFIPEGLYKGTEGEIPSFGMRALLLSTTDVADEVVYAFVKSVFQNLDSLRKLHPALVELDAKDMVHSGITIPLHPGAEKYYREMGMLK